MMKSLKINISKDASQELLLEDYVSYFFINIIIFNRNTSMMRDHKLINLKFNAMARRQCFIGPYNKNPGFIIS